jgi:uncharacterized membrane protein
MTVEAEKQAPAEKETGRIEAFSDGVFSVALTLLVVDLRPPHLAHEGVWQFWEAMIRM